MTRGQRRRSTAHGHQVPEALTRPVRGQCCPAHRSLSVLGAAAPAPSRSDGHRLAEGRGVLTRSTHPGAGGGARSSIVSDDYIGAAGFTRTRIQNSEFRVCAERGAHGRKKNQNSEFRIQNSEPETLMPRHIRHAPEFRIQNSEQQPARRRAAHSTQNSEFRIQTWASAESPCTQPEFRIQNSEHERRGDQKTGENSEFRIYWRAHGRVERRIKRQASEFKMAKGREQNSEFRADQNSEGVVNSPSLVARGCRDPTRVAGGASYRGSVWWLVVGWW